MRARRPRIALLVAALLTAVTVTAPARDLVPANDNFADATPIDILPFSSGHDMLLAGSEPGEPSCSAAMPHTVWYSFRWPAAIDLLFDLDGFVTLGIYTGSQVGALNQVACESNAFEGIVFSAEPDRTYYFQLGVGRQSVLLDLPNDHVRMEVSALGRISGSVTGPGGRPVSGVCVQAYPEAVGFEYPHYDATTLTNGTYTLSGLRADTYKVSFGCGRWATEWYDDQSRPGTADRIVVGAGAWIAGIDAALSEGSFISGTIRRAGGGVVSDGCVVAYDAVGDFAAYATSEPDGRYVFNVPAGTYRLRFGCTYRWPYVTQWYDGRGSFESADPVTVLSQAETSGIDVTLDLKPIPSNDLLEDAAEITSLPYSDTFYPDMLDFTVEPEACTRSFPAAVWYEITPSADMLLVASASSTGWGRADVVVFEGAVSQSRRIACTDFEHGRAVFHARAGTRYIIEVVGGESFFDSEPVTFRIDEALGRSTHDLGPLLPCAIACAYWVAETEQDEAACAETPAGVPGSWQDIAVTVPADIGGHAPAEIAFWMRPSVDSDVWLCRASPDSEGKRFVSQSAYGSSECGAEPAWCVDTLTAPVAPGASYVVRVYNWADEPNPRAMMGFVVDR